MAKLTESQKAAITRLAQERGEDPGLLLHEARLMLENPGAADAPPAKSDSSPDKPPPPNAAADSAKASSASPDGDGADEEGKAEDDAESAPNGGRGFYAYQYPFLKVNEIRASVGLKPIPDGELFSGEWLPKHDGGASKTSGNGGNGGEAQA